MLSNRPALLFLSLLVFIYLGYFNSSDAQGSIDSLKQVVRETKKDSVRTLNYIKLSYSYYTISTDSSLVYALKGYELAKKMDHKIFIGAALKELGRCYVYKLQYNLALHYFNQARSYK